MTTTDTDKGVTCPSCGDDRAGKGSLIYKGMTFCNEGCHDKWSETKRNEFLRSCGICKQDAAQSGHKLFVRRRLNGFIVSGDGSGDWLFYAYPGGRTVLSLEGAKLAGVEK